MFDDLARRASRPTAKGKRPAASELNDLDMYVAGCPCQSFSTAGDSLGIADQREGRGTLCVHIFKFIAIAKPKCVILENVAGLTQGKHKRSFALMMTFLEQGLDDYVFGLTM